MLIETILDGIVNILQASVVMLFDDLPTFPPTRASLIIAAPSTPSPTTASITGTDSGDSSIPVDNTSHRILPPLPSDDEDDEDDAFPDLADTIMLDYIRRQNPLLSSLLAVNSIDDDAVVAPPTELAPSSMNVTHDSQDWTDDFVAGA